MNWNVSFLLHLIDNAPFTGKRTLLMESAITICNRLSYISSKAIVRDYSEMWHKLMTSPTIRILHRSTLHFVHFAPCNLYLYRAVRRHNGGEKIGSPKIAVCAAQDFKNKTAVTAF